MKNIIRNRVFIILSICLIALTAMSACAQQAPAPTTSTVNLTPSTAAGPKTGGILKAHIGADGNGCGFPATTLFLQDLIISRTCVDTLIRIDDKGFNAPWLAESWTTDESSKSITFKLRKGVKFHDGTDFNAAAVKWNLEAFTKAGRPELAKISSMDIIDDYTIRLNLSVWDSTLLMTLAWQSAGYMISPTAWQKAPGATTDKERNAWAQNNPVSTGPFQFVSWAKSTKQVYKKFANYWGKGQPYLDGVEWNIISDPMVASAAFQAKEVDVLYAVSPTTANSLKKAGYNITKLASGGGVQFRGFIPQMASPDSVFKDISLRQALGYAVDPKSIIDGIYYGFASPINQYSATGNPWSNPDVKGYSYDLAKAQQLMTAAGYSASNPLKTTIHTENVPDDIVVSTALQSMLAKAYINATVKPSERGFMQQLQKTGQWDGLMYANLHTDPEPAMNFLRIVASTGDMYTKAMIHPEEMEKLYPQIRSCSKTEDRIKVIWQLQKLAFDTHCLINPYFMIDGLAVKQPYVKDDNFQNIYMTIWTPESAWLDK